MSDLSTFAGQAEHYAAVKARLHKTPPTKPGQVQPQRRMYLLPKVRTEPKVAYGCPINLLAAPSARNIIKLVSLKHGVSVDDIVGPRRYYAFTGARQMAVMLCHSHCPHLSLPALGRIFNRDHTSILYLLGGTKRSKARLAKIEASA